MIWANQIDISDILKIKVTLQPCKSIHKLEWIFLFFMFMLI